MENKNTKTEVKKINKNKVIYYYLMFIILIFATLLFFVKKKNFSFNTKQETIAKKDKFQVLNDKIEFVNSKIIENERGNSQLEGQITNLEIEIENLKVKNKKNAEEIYSLKTNSPNDTRKNIKILLNLYTIKDLISKGKNISGEIAKIKILAMGDNNFLSLIADLSSIYKYDIINYNKKGS